MKNNLISTIVIVVLVGAVGFFGGMKYQESKLPQGRFAFGQRNGQTQNGARQGLRPVSGEIISVDDKSITVKLKDGSSKIVILSDKTVINKTSQATKTDLKKGEQVAAFGTENSDGSLTAQNVQLNPMLRSR